MPAGTKCVHHAHTCMPNITGTTTTAWPLTAGGTNAYMHVVMATHIITIIVEMLTGLMTGGLITVTTLITMTVLIIMDATTGATSISRKTITTVIMVTTGTTVTSTGREDSNLISPIYINEK